MTRDPDARWAEIQEQMRQRAAEDPVFAEELVSWGESGGYVFQPDKMTEPIRCEMCGTMVCLIPEAEVLVTPWVFRPGIREPDSFRRHTLRRCTWLRDSKSA
jgi:hypothetical protein